MAFNFFLLKGGLCGRIFKGGHDKVNAPLYCRLQVYTVTSFNPQNLRNTIKNVAKISITQTIIIELVCQNNRILLFFLTPHKFYTFRLVVNINTIT